MLSSAFTTTVGDTLDCLRLVPRVLHSRDVTVEDACRVWVCNSTLGGKDSVTSGIESL